MDNNGQQDENWNREYLNKNFKKNIGGRDFVNSCTMKFDIN